MLDSSFCESNYFPSVLFAGIKIADFTKLEERNASLNIECIKKMHSCRLNRKCSSIIIQLNTALNHTIKITIQQ